MEYNFDFEAKWRKYWQEEGVYNVTEDSARPKFYILDMFPYPSGAGLHVGHPLGYVASDIMARFKKMKGFNVLHPMGYDAFGLPAEQYAVETGTHPAITTAKAMARYREQLDKIGFNYDWDRMVNTSSPDYYKWTQWMFIQLFESWYNRASNKAESIKTLEAHFAKKGTADLLNFNETHHTVFSAEDWNTFDKKEKAAILMHYRLAYQSFTEVNWCDALGSVLANDEISNGKSERGGHPVTKKKMKQWSLRITEYSDRLLEGLDTIDWPSSMKDVQRNWIGRSEGASITFKTENDVELTVFTTRADTIFGATFLVIAPEHELLNSLTTTDQKEAIESYITYVKQRSDIERQQEKKVTGAFTGSYAVHPFTGKKVPIWVAEYVLGGYGTGAIMAVPADDERDKKFAEKFGLDIVEVIDKSMHPGATIEDKLGVMINSDFLNGLEVKDAIKKAIEVIDEKGIGKRKINYKQRDAGFSRQRYWGEPFPVRYTEDGQIEILDEAKLPLELPHVDSFKPTGDGRSPLANNAEWVAQNYETDTMPGYAGSSWYFLRYMDPTNKEAFASKQSLDYWENVDIYFGGSEHGVGHLLYARFWHKFLFDLGYVKTDEPFKKLVNQGMIQGRSSFIFRLNRQYFKPFGAGMPMDDAPNIYVTKEIADEIANKNLSAINSIKIETAIKAAKEIFNFMCYNNIDDLTANVVDDKEKDIYHQSIINNRLKGSFKFELDFMPIHCDISLVNNDKLNLDKALKINIFNRFDLFVLNSDGNYLCGSEVEKMSKSKYNVVNPDDVIEKYGADCFRMFEMFLGPIEQSKPWDDKGISGVASFLRKFWRLFYDEKTGWKVTDEAANDKELKVLHKTIKKVSDDIEKMSFNTSVSQFMIATSELQDLKCSKRAILEPMLLCLAPFAPYITEELWSKLGNTGSVHLADFPVFEEKYLKESEIEYPISINGKTRASILLSADATQEEAQAQVSKLESVLKWTEDKPFKKFIFVKGRIINIVI